MDVSSAYGGHFALRVLVLPVHPIRKSEYHKHLELLRKQTRIALADVPPTSATHVGPVNGSSSSSSSNLTKAASDAVPSTTIHSSLAPTPTSRGHLNLEFVEDWQSNYGGLGWLEDFQINRRTMAVVGIMDCGEWEDDLSEGAASFNRSVFENGPPSGVFAKRCYAFNPSETQKDNAEGLVVIPTVGDLSFYINTLLAELASGILAGLSNVVSGSYLVYLATRMEHVVKTKVEADCHRPADAVHRRKAANTHTAGKANVFDYSRPAAGASTNERGAPAANDARSDIPKQISRQLDIARQRVRQKQSGTFESAAAVPQLLARASWCAA